MSTPSEVDVVVVEDASAAARAVATLLADAAREGGAIVLAGGSTPREAYALVAAEALDWSAVELWLGDERVVPLDHEHSNGRLVRETLVALLDAPPTLQVVRTELGAEAAADDYDARLRDVRARFALLGLGPDGHTASLFPNAPALSEHNRLAIAAEPGLEPWVERVTMTLPVLTAVEHVVFMALGDDKAEAARRAFVEPPSPSTPASLVRSESGRTTAVLDRAAAALLP